MLNVLLIGAVSFVLTLLAIPVIIRVADEKKLFDVPDARKLHNRPIASLGGVGVFIGFFLAILLCVNTRDTQEFRFLLGASLVTFFLGIKDDILVLSAKKKFLGQVAAAAILVHLAGIQIDSMHGIFGLQKIPAAVGIILSYTTIIVVVNAYNLIDGVDGLAGSLGVASSAVFGTYFIMANMPAYALFSFALCGSLVAFLIFNFQPAKIFMGDSGSLLVGLINAILVIKFINVADGANVAMPLTSSVAIGFSILIVPLLDTLRVFSIRASKGQSPFDPDRNHVHHLMLDRGFSHQQITLSLVGLTLSFVSMAYLGRSLGSTILIPVMVTVFYSLVGLLIYMKKPVAKVVVARLQHNHEATVQSATKLVALKPEPAAIEQ